MKRTIIRGVSALLLLAASVAGAESIDGSPVEVLKENRLSYTDGFVDAVKGALDASPAQPQPPATGKPCDWSLTATPDPHNAQFLAFAGSQQLKYEVALIGYDVYDKARLNAKGAPADSEASRKLRFLQYMLGLSGYWEALAADHEKTLLSPACEGVVRNWREGTIVNARDNFAPATSAMGDVLLAVLTADINRTLGTKAAFVWGAYQEALAQFGVEQSISGWFYTTDLDPRGPINWTTTLSGPMCPSGEACPSVTKEQSYIPQMVWLTLPVDILSYTGDATTENLLIEARGKHYMEEFEKEVGDQDSLLVSTRNMLRIAQASQDVTPDQPQGRLALWLKQHSLPLASNLVGGVLPLPQSVSVQNKEMKKALLFAQQVERDLLNFPESKHIDQMVVTRSAANASATMTICDLYDGAIEGWLLSENFTCITAK